MKAYRRMAWACAAAAGAILSLGAQAPPAFEVATVKPSGVDSAPLGIKRTPDQFLTSNTSVAFLIRWAYDLDETRLIGAPKGLESGRFDIVAKIPKGELPLGQLELMMQSLLADRFQLRVHKETRERSSYTLAADKGGAKVHFVDLGEGIGQNPFKMTDRGRLVGTKVTAEMLAKVLASQIGRPVEDVTAIDRPFDFVLEWTPDNAMSGMGAQAASPETPSRPSIFTAIREQLGFRLVARKSPVDVIVIDSVSVTPTAN